MGILKLIIAFAAIGLLELYVDRNNIIRDREDSRSFDLCVSILFAGWIMYGGL